MSGAEGAARAVKVWVEDGAGLSFGEWLARNCVIRFDLVSRFPKRSGPTFHERKAARIAARNLPPAVPAESKQT